MAAKYDPDSEAEVISWFKELFGVDLQAGMREIEHQLRDGQLLVRYQLSLASSGGSSPKKLGVQCSKVIGGF